MKTVLAVAVVAALALTAPAQAGMFKKGVALLAVGAAVKLCMDSERCSSFIREKGKAAFVALIEHGGADVVMACFESDTCQDVVAKVASLGDD